MRVETVRVKREGGRGSHLINKSDFNPDVHELLDAAGKPADKGMTVVELKAALDEKGIEYQATAKKADLQALLDAAG